MLKLRHLLLALLLFGVATNWVPQRWAPCALATAAAATAAVRLIWLAARRRAIGFDWPAAGVAAMALWAAVQLRFGWTAVTAETHDALLYWLAAAALTWIAAEVCRDPVERRAFLASALGSGVAICLAGMVQLYTSPGRVFWIFPSGYESGVIGPFVSPNLCAVFVELLLPAVLICGLDGRPGSTGWLWVAGTLVAMVFAGGSRAGASLVVAESAAVFLMRRRAPVVRRAWLAFVGVAVAAGLIFGWGHLGQKLAGRSDMYQLRREFFWSSLAMFRSRPVHGFGLGTWPWVYRQFALLDPGALVNHAHNEWAQWAAEGGVVALLLMALLFVWCARAALRSIWGLGVVAVFLHSAVDYPFLRPGLAAWIFVWIGALAASTRSVESGAEAPSPRAGAWRRLAAVAAALTLAAAGWMSARDAYADALYRQGRPDTVARAIRLRSDRAEYWAAAAATDSGRALPDLRQALALNPYFTDGGIALASELEQRGDPAGAEAVLLATTRHDRQLAPAWAAANFYFRAGRPAAFWMWARRVAEVAPGDLSSLFDLCSLMSGNPDEISRRVASGQPAVELRLLGYLNAMGRAGEARGVALRVAQTAGDDAGGREALLDYIDRSLEGGSNEAAAEAWNAACQRGLLTLGPAVPGILRNSGFRQAVTNRGFDWRIATQPGIFATQSRGLLALSFSGKQPEDCDVLNQWISVRAAAYVLRIHYRTRQLPAATGLFWSIGSSALPLASSEKWADSVWPVRPPAGWARLRLMYRRPLGATRIEGELWIREIRLDAL